VEGGVDDVRSDLNIAKRAATHCDARFQAAVHDRGAVAPLTRAPSLLPRKRVRQRGLHQRGGGGARHTHVIF
jgi:hypothetical protein